MLQKSGEIKYVGYDKSFEGIIRSFIERFEGDFDHEMYSYWKAARDFFKPI